MDNMNTKNGREKEKKRENEGDGEGQVRTKTMGRKGKGDTEGELSTEIKWSRWKGNSTRKGGLRNTSKIESVVTKIPPSSPIVDGEKKRKRNKSRSNKRRNNVGSQKDKYSSELLYFVKHFNASVFKCRTIKKAGNLRYLLGEIKLMEKFVVP